ncbi:ABC transporter permease [Mycoplasmatota bacterium]|nr:ABC transporter permease [Mycoplasmatota bacterium]
MSIFTELKCVMKMQFLRRSGMLTTFSLLFIFMSLGIITGFNFLIGDATPEAILYLSTGAPAYILIVCGLVMLPQQVAISKGDGYIDYQRTWSVRRPVILIADTIIWLLITIPGIILSILFAHFMYDPGFNFSLTVVPGVLFTALTCIGIGYGIAFFCREEITMIITQIIVFGALMFSPINFPIQNLPEWLQSVHRVLPIYSMGETMRASLAQTIFTASIGHYINLAIWCVIGFGGSMLVLSKKN